METTRLKGHAAGFLLVLLLAWFPATGVSQINKGSLSGIVTDPSGAVVPGANVELVETETEAKQQTTADTSGYYAFSLLDLGTYVLTITRPGFKTYTSTDIVLNAGTNARVDVTLQVGQTSQQVTVTGEVPALETRNPAVGNIEDTKTLAQLPLQLSGAKRDPTQYEATIPGYQGGAGFTSNFNGSIGTYNELLVNGAPAECNPAVLGGCLRASFSSEAVSEFKVASDTTADMGFTAGAVVSIVSKSGTNTFHGSAYEYLRNDDLDARSFFSPSVPKDKQNEFGFTVGGPVVIPHVYNGKSKTFFFFNLGWFRFLNAAAGSVLTMPIQAYRNGDFSSLLGPQIGTDALGRPVLSGEIYDPSTTRVVNGTIVRDPFFGNMIQQAAFSPVSAKFQSFYPQLTFSNQTSNNYVESGGTGATRERTVSIQIDQYVGPNHISGFFWTDHSTNASPFPLPDIFAVRDASFTVGHNIRLDWTRSFSPTTVNDAVLGMDRAFDTLYSDKAAANNGAALIGQPNALGPCLPAVHIGAFFAGTQTELKCGQSEGDTNWRILDNLSHTRGKHLLKFGFDWIHWNGNFPVTNNGQFTFLGAETGLPGPFLAQTGFPYASFLLGAVDDSAVQGGNYEDGRSYTFGFYAQDEYKVTPKLTLSLGLRYDAQPFPEMDKNEVSQFNPRLPNPGAGNLPGALTFAGVGPGRLGIRRVAPSHWFDRNFAPRVGFAYQLRQSTVVRGSYGVYWGPVTQQMAGFDAIEQQGFFPLFTKSSTDGFTPAFDWTNGFPLPPEGIGPNFSPTVANGSNTYYFGPDAGRAPFIEMVHLDLQHQFRSNVVVTGGYVGQFARGVIATGVENINQINYAKYGSLGSLLTADINSQAARAGGIPIPYAGFQGTVAQALRPFPQYLTVMNEGSAISWSNYNSVQIKAQKEFSNGLSFLVGYTISKNLADISTSVPGFFASSPQDFFNHRAEKALSNIDIPQAMIFNYVYELPFGPGKKFANSRNSMNRYLLGGWSITGVHQSGSPVGVTTEQVLPTMGGALNAALLRPNRVPGVRIGTGVGCSGFDPAKDKLLNVAAFTDPPPFQFGNVSRTLGNVRACGFANENITLNKTIPLHKERATLRIGIDTFNLLNRVQWAGPATDVDAPAQFGTITGTGTGRIVQLHARIDW